jgi:exosortase/archaeosortase family protein
MKIVKNWYRLLLLFILIIVYYYFKWHFYRTFLASQVSFVADKIFNLDVLCHGDVISLCMSGKTIEITSRCTQFLLCFVSFAFFYNFKRPLTSILYLGIFLIIVQLVNLLRILYAVVMWAKGYSWFWSHDVLNVIFVLTMFGSGYLVSKYLLASCPSSSCPKLEAKD